MQRRLPRVDDLVTISDHDTAMVYTIDQVYTDSGRVAVTLKYPRYNSGQLVGWANAGTVDASLICEPTTEQLCNYIKQ